MSIFPYYSKRKADAVSNGVFFVMLGILFYTDQWWPGILFAIALSYSLRQYLTGRRLDLFISLVAIGVLGLLTLAGHLLSGLFPFLFIAVGLFIVAREFKGLFGSSQSSSKE